MKTYLILDVHYLAHRAFYTMGTLSHGDVKTGVIYGFLKEIIALKEAFGSDDVVFCFDSKNSKRKDLFPDYKKKRHSKDRTAEELKALAEFRQQIVMLRKEYLATIGYRNVFWKDGYESDDIIASVSAAIPDDDEGIIITADKDLYQLIRPNVIFHNPDKRRTVTLQSFVATYGIQPKQWARVLALAGCKTDEVPGIAGIGTKTAISYILGTLKPTSKKYAAIKSEEGLKTMRRNKPLVLLPFEGVGTFELQKDAVTKEGWRTVTEALGMKSLRDQSPLAARRERTGFNIKSRHSHG